MVKRPKFLVLLLVAVLAVSLSTLRITGALESEVPNHRVVLYAEGPVLGLPSDADLRTAGLTVARSQADMLDSLNATTKAILLTPETVGKVDREWIKSRMDKGLVLGGVNMSKAEVASATDLTHLVSPEGSPRGIDPIHAAWKPAAQPYFSLLYDSAKWGQGATIWLLDPAPLESRDNAQTLMRHVERFIATASR